MSQIIKRNGRGPRNLSCRMGDASSPCDTCGRRLIFGEMIVSNERTGGIWCGWQCWALDPEAIIPASAATATCGSDYGAAVA